MEAPGAGSPVTPGAADLLGYTARAEDMGPSEHHGLRGQQEDEAEGLRDPQCQGLCSVYIEPLGNELGQQQDSDRGL